MYKSIVHEWFDQIWNKGNADAVHRLLAPDGVIHNLAQDGKDSTGPAEFLLFHKRFREAFPDAQVVVHESAAEGDIVSGRWTATATHTGDGLGFPPTDKQVSFGGMSFARVKDGRIIEGWNLWDAAAMQAQLGFLSTPPARH